MRKIILVTLSIFLVVEVSYAEGLECRMSGGAVATTSDSSMVSLAGQVGASSTDQPPKGEIVIMTFNRFIFQAGTASAPPGTAITGITCFDLGVCDPARPSPANGAMITGIGAFRNIDIQNGLVDSAQVESATLHFFTVEVEDNGDPPRGATTGCSDADSFGVTIHETSELSSAVIYEADDLVITGGNFQIHPPIQGHPYLP